MVYLILSIRIGYTPVNQDTHSNYTIIIIKYMNRYTRSIFLFIFNLKLSRIFPVRSFIISLEDDYKIKGNNKNDKFVVYAFVV